jgi:SAM-dependent methyltransferase
MIKSPVTGTENIALDTTLDPKRIVAGYADAFGFDAEHYYKGLENLPLYICRDTGYRFFYPPELAGDESLYRCLEKYDWYYARWKWENDFVLGKLEKKQRLLDIGCGDGFFIDGLQKHFIKAEGLELNKSAAEKARAKGLTIHTETLAEFAIKNENVYDVVCSMQVLEHIYDVRDFMTTAARLVRPGGLLIVAVPNNNPYLYRYEVYVLLNLPPHHMGLWDESSLRKAAPYFGVEVENIVTEPLHGHERYHYFHLMAEKRFPKWMQKTVARARSLVSRLIGEKIDGRNLVAVYRKPLATTK